ncbi:hypothetical protein CRE_28768 [Caenorhabditis remanei]|uniref:Uncharacterized protein n=1 Tax=Caenorhabditis remanei TaxID=31234 RepID=E3MJX2_CAERE|nr:hypothetical protein CRE_28768 [Caenorhabditis remanei]
MQRPPRYPGLSSVEEKVALALADKEGIALKRQRAIQEEAEKKRLKKEAADRAKQKALKNYPISFEFLLLLEIKTHYNFLKRNFRNFCYLFFFATNFLSFRTLFLLEMFTNPRTRCLRCFGTQPKTNPTKTNPTKANPTKTSFRSVSCQVKPNNIPGFHCLQYIGTESQCTGVHFKEDYGYIRTKVEVPTFLPFNAPIPDSIPEKVLSVWDKEKKAGKVTAKKAQVQGIIRNPVETAPVEEKYCGPLLDGSAPEMIVPSGALGMTETRRKQQINYQQSKRKRTVDAGFGISEAGPPKVYKPKSYQPIDHLNSHDSYYEGSMPSSSSSFPTISDFESEPGNIDPISQSILRCIENSLTETREESDFPIEYTNEKSVDVDNLIAQVHEFAAPIEEPAPELTEEEKRRIEENEKVTNIFTLIFICVFILQAIARFREIGRRICEIELIDFSADKGKNDRKTFMIASRGEEILATVRRNLAVIRDKLGEYAKGTIFDYVDELSNSFADVTPNAITRLNMVVAEKMRQNTMQEVEKAATSSSESGEFKTEDFEVKLEPPEYTED